MATPILVTDLTTGQIDGLGVFDKLMAATKPHIKAEYDSGRIKGADYSQVYLGAVQSAMSQSIELLLRQAATQAQNALLDQQLLTEVENTLVATATKCKLQGEFDLLVQQKLRVIQETALMSRKIVTEEAQTTAANIDATSVVGSQIALYTAQKDGFARDAEQKAAKLYFDTWNVRRTTDVTVDPTTTNKLTDADVGAVAAKLKTGIGL